MVSDDHSCLWVRFWVDEGERLLAQRYGRMPFEVDSTVKEIVEPGDTQAGSLEDRLKGFRLQDSLPMDRNGHPMSEAITYPPMEVYMATFLIEHHEPSPPKRLQDVFSGDPRETGHYTATSSASIPFDTFSFFSKMCSWVTARRYNLMASLMFVIASSRVRPSLTQPGSAGHVTVYPSRLLPSRTTGSFIVLSSS